MRLNRRQFAGSLALGALSAAAPAPFTSTANAAAFKPAGRVDRKDRKEWARGHFRGFENILMPSFVPGSGQLDEAGIRLDVRQSIDHGFFSSMCALETLSAEESRAMVAIALDEAKGRIGIGSSAGAHPATNPAKMAVTMQTLTELDRLGSGHFLLNLADADSEKEMIRIGSQFSESTDMGIVLWWANHHRYDRFSTNGIPYRAFDELAKLPNVVAMKFGSTDPAQIFDMFERYDDRLLIGNLWFNAMPLAVKFYGQQWSGATTIEMMQSPKKRYCVDWFNFLMAGRYDAAEELYWRRVAPGFATMMNFMNRKMPRGAHPWDHLKFFQFVTGGNGGTSRLDPGQPDLPPIDLTFMNEVKENFRKLEIKPTELGAEAFRLGRVNYPPEKRS